MIQRIQSLYLALATALSGFLAQGSISRLIGFNGESYELTFRGLFELADNGTVTLIENTLPLTILLILVPVLFFIALFLFKRRKLQIRVTVFATLLFAGAFLLILYYVFYTGRKLDADLIFTIKLVFPIAGVVFGYLAFRAILKDELLIKSYDRIR